MSANDLHIGIAGSAVNALGEIFHLPDRVAGKTCGRAPDVVVSRSTQRIPSLYDHEFFIGFELGHDDCFL
jgi:hypothetical protein